MKLGINNLHHKKVPFSNTILFPDVATFPKIMNFFLISVTGFRNIEYYLKCSKESHLLQSLCDVFRESSILNIYSKVLKVNNR